MANSSLRFLLGLYPKTNNIEKHRSELIKEFDEINEYARSEELSRYEYLDKFINSPEFSERKLYYKNLTYKNENSDQNMNKSCQTVDQIKKLFLSLYIQRINWTTRNLYSERLLY